MPSWRSVSPIFPGFRAYLKSSSAMKIMDVQWYSYRLPLLNSFTTAHGVMTAREGIIVQVTTEQGISGIGEIAPLPAFGGGSLADVRSLLPALAARLHEKTLAEALDLLLTGSKAGNVGADVSARLHPYPLRAGNRAARCAWRSRGMWSLHVTLSSWYCTASKSAGQRRY